MNPLATCPNDNNRRTPQQVIDLARLVLGTIDLDPASDEEANRAVRASKIYTGADGGLHQPWGGRVFLNPPGGLLDPETYQQLPKGVRPKGALSSAAVWWAKLEYCYRAQGSVSAAIFVAFNAEIMLNAQKFGPPPQNYPFCVPNKRIAYQSPAGEKSSSPSGCSMIVYLGDNPKLFRHTFGELGYCT